MDCEYYEQFGECCCSECPYEDIYEDDGWGWSDADVDPEMGCH